MGIQLTGLASGLDTQSMVEDLMKAQRMKVDKIRKEKTRTEWKKEVWKDMNTKLYTFYKESLFKFKSAGTYMSKKVSSSNESLVAVKNTNTAVSGSHSIEISNMAKGSFLTSGAITDKNGDAASSATKLSDLMTMTGDVTLSFKTGKSDDFEASNEVTLSADDTIADVVSKVKNLGLDLNVSYDSKFNRLFFSSSETGENTEIGISAGVDGSSNSEAVNLLGKLGLATSTVDVNGTTYDAVIGSTGENAAFKYNGTDLVSETNDISVNGLDLQIRADSGTVSIDVKDDSDAVYDAVKNFVKSYNELMTEMNDKLTADSAKNYDPLTDDEKASMTDTEIEDWEKKIKDSLLRRDDILGTIQNDMRSILSSSVGVDLSGLDFNFLSDLGIVTGEYTERGKLHIEGDADEDLYNTKTNKLKEAIEKNPDGVKDFFVKVGQTLYDTMRKKMGTTELSSTLTFYNNKYMDEQIDDYDSEISDMEEKLAKVEQRYYAQFTAMEKAMQQSNSTGNWLAQQLQSM